MIICRPLSAMEDPPNPKRVRIARCSLNGAWWEEHVGAIITVIFTDSHGHWTRDTGPMRCIQWVRPEDCEPT